MLPQGKLPAGKRVHGVEKQLWQKLLCLGVWRMVLRVQDPPPEGSWLPGGHTYCFPLLPAAEETRGLME